MAGPRVKIRDISGSYHFFRVGFSFMRPSTLSNFMETHVPVQERIDIIDLFANTLKKGDIWAKIKFVLEHRVKHNEVTAVRSFGLMETVNHATRNLYELSRAFQSNASMKPEISYSYTMLTLRAGLSDIAVYGAFTDQLPLKAQITEEVMQLVMIEDLQRDMSMRYGRYEFVYDVYKLTRHTMYAMNHFGKLLFSVDQPAILWDDAPMVGL